MNSIKDLQTKLSYISYLSLKYYKQLFSITLNYNPVRLGIFYSSIGKRRFRKRRC